jgi:hypothetical protein
MKEMVRDLAPPIIRRGRRPDIMNEILKQGLDRP